MTPAPATPLPTMPWRPLPMLPPEAPIGPSPLHAGGFEAVFAGLTQPVEIPTVVRATSNPAPGTQVQPPVPIQIETPLPPASNAVVPTPIGADETASLPKQQPNIALKVEQPQTARLPQRETDLPSPISDAQVAPIPAATVKELQLRPSAPAETARAVQKTVYVETVEELVGGLSAEVEDSNASDLQPHAKSAPAETARAVQKTVHVETAEELVGGLSAEVEDSNVSDLQPHAKADEGEEPAIPSAERAALPIALPEPVMPPIAPAVIAVQPKLEFAKTGAAPVAVAAEINTEPNASVSLIPATAEAKAFVVEAAMPQPVQQNAALPTIQPTPADPTIAVAERALDLAQGDQWIDRMASEIVAASTSDKELNFRLLPARLGQLDVRIETHDEGMQLRFTAQSEDTAQSVAAAQPRLVEELRSQGVRVASTEIAANPNPNFTHGDGSNSGAYRPSAFTFTDHLEPDETPDTPVQSGRFA